jgi:hypothetical protein
MQRRYLEITAKLKTGDFNFLLICEKGEVLTQTIVWWTIYNSENREIDKRFHYEQKEISVVDYIKSQKPKFKTGKVNTYTEKFSSYLSSLLIRPLNFNDRVLPSALP